MKVLITGGTGSFGNAMIKRLLKTDVEEIRVLSRNEKLQVETKLNTLDDRVKFYIGDVRNIRSVNEAMENVDYVFHAAAMKHIDKCSSFPKEAVDININGSMNVMLSAIDNKVKKIILLSTDKATSATTIYGATKLTMEQIAQNVVNKDTQIITTRYGNVLGSNGSVVEIFKRLVKENKPLTITDPNMTRFFMSLDEAVDLVLYALENGKHKDLFVFNNKSCTIQELADCFSSNQIVTGVRCTEKTDEALLTLNELSHSELNGDYFKVNAEIQSEITYTMPLTSDNAKRLDRTSLLELINEC